MLGAGSSVIFCSWAASKILYAHRPVIVVRRWRCRMGLLSDFTERKKGRSQWIAISKRKNRAPNLQARESTCKRWSDTCKRWGSTCGVWASGCVSWTRG